VNEVAVAETTLKFSGVKSTLLLINQVFNAAKSAELTASFTLGTTLITVSKSTS